MSRHVYEIVTPAGLEGAGVLDMDFDPGFQTLVFHHIRVIRDGVVREIDPRPGLELMRRERDLERAKFDGRLTAHFTIPDIRVGDILDVCHSHTGRHPVLKDRFAAEWQFEWSCWVGETRVRLIAPTGRNFEIQSWNGAPACEIEALEGGMCCRTWRASSTAPLVWEGEAPTWARQIATVRVADAMSWAQVADVFRGFYDPQPLPAELAVAATAIEQEAEGPAERAVRALRLIQETLRYQSVTIGEGGFAPRDLASIWESRIGDCKDASRLLVALLTRLDLDATPALVNTYRGERLADEAPSLTAFDHCIVRLVLDGEHYWLDPTRFPQGGRLDVLMQARFGRALPLTVDSELEDMGSHPLQESFAIKEVFELPPTTTMPARVRIETSHFGWRADSTRRLLAGGIGVVARDFQAHAERRYGALANVRPLEVADDLDANVVRIVEEFEVNQIWRKSLTGDLVAFETVDELFAPNLLAVGPEGRRWPIDLGMPLRAVIVIEIHAPVNAKAAGWDDVFEISGLRSASKLSSSGDGKQLKLTRSLTFEQPVLDASRAREYADFRERTLAGAGLIVRHAVRNGRIVAGEEKLTVFQKIWGVVVLLWVFGAVARFLFGAG